MDHQQIKRCKSLLGIPEEESGDAYFKKYGPSWGFRSKIFTKSMSVDVTPSMLEIIKQESNRRNFASGTIAVFYVNWVKEQEEREARAVENYRTHFMCGQKYRTKKITIHLREVDRNQINQRALEKALSATAYTLAALIEVMLTPEHIEKAIQAGLEMLQYENQKLAAA